MMMHTSGCFSFEPNISHITKDSVAKNNSVSMLAVENFLLKYK